MTEYLVITGFSNNIFTGEYTGGSSRAKWSGDSIPSISYGMQVYLLKPLYDSLHEYNKGVARSHVQGLVSMPYVDVIDGVRRFCQSSIVECFQPTCYMSRPDITPEPKPNGTNIWIATVVIIIAYTLWG